MADDSYDDDEVERLQSRTSLWTQNHGNLLLAVAGIIFSAGAIWLLYQQHRASIRPVRFPDGRAIVQVQDNRIGVDGAPDRLKINITGAANDKGALMLAVYDSPASFQTGQALIKDQAKIVNGEVIWMVPKTVLPDSFAIKAYHDENSDGKLNQHGLTGIPTERYGFSKDARGAFGPPSYADAMIEISDLEKNPITIVIR